MGVPEDEEEEKGRKRRGRRRRFLKGECLKRVERGIFGMRRDEDLGEGF